MSPLRPLWTGIPPLPPPSPSLPQALSPHLECSAPITLPASCRGPTLMAVAPEASSGAPAAAVAPTVLPNHPAQTLHYDQLAEGDHCVCTVDVARGKVDVTLNISEWR